VTAFFSAAGLPEGKVGFLAFIGAGATGLFFSDGETVLVSVESVGKEGVSIELVSGVVSTLGDGAASTVGAGLLVSVKDIVWLEVV
jgi:hypothetical protein